MTRLELHLPSSHAATTLPAMRRGGDSRKMLGIFVVAFALLLLVAMSAQLIALPWRSWLPGAEGKSLIGGVKTSVYTFMSYLT
jgi:light-harvesting complex 1 beta chain